MSGQFLGFFVELLVAVLLVATIGYCVIVNKKLTRLRADQQGLKIIVQELNMATQQAESAIAGLRNVVAEAEEGLAERVETAADAIAMLDAKLQSAAVSVGAGAPGADATAAAGRVAQPAQPVAHQRPDDLRRTRPGFSDLAAQMPIRNLTRREVRGAA